MADRARILLMTDPAITPSKGLDAIRKLKEFYWTFYQDEECEVVLLESFTHPIVREGVENAVEFTLNAIESFSKRHIDGGKAAGMSEIMSDAHIDMALVVHEGELSEYLKGAIVRLAKNLVFTIVIGV